MSIPRFRLRKADPSVAPSTYDIVVDGKVVGIVTKITRRTNAYSHAGNPRPGYHVTTVTWRAEPNRDGDEFETRTEAVEVFLDQWVKS